MDLVNMKMSDEERAEEIGSALADAPEYPYGLQIQLDDEQLAALGQAATPQVGATMMIEARVKVMGVRKQDVGDGEESVVSLQITDMELGPDNGDDSDEQQPLGIGLYQTDGG